MSEKINVLGVEIENIDLVKAMGRVHEYTNTEVLSTIGMITTGVLLAAGSDLEYREKIEHLSMHVIGDKEVLAAAGIDSAERQLEVEEGWFLTAFFEYIQENENTLALLCETKQECAALQNHLEEVYPRINMVGVFALAEMAADADSIVNLINGVSADIILASLGIPEQENFVFQNRTKLNVKVWLGIGKSLKIKNRPELKSTFLEKLIEKRIFKKKMNQYHQKKGEL